MNSKLPDVKLGGAEDGDAGSVMSQSLTDLDRSLKDMFLASGCPKLSVKIVFCF